MNRTKLKRDNADCSGYGTSMAINADKPQLWKADVERSIDFFNDWFIRFAPETYREQQQITTAAVLDAFGKTANLTRIIPKVLYDAPGLLPILRMVTAPPLARDRLMGLAHVSRAFIGSLEGKDPYAMPPGTFVFRLSLPAGDKTSSVNIPIDCAVKPLSAASRDMPVLIEAKSAGDATNTNRRRKEEAQKLHQLKRRYGNNITFLLYLCGYFEPGYLGYEAAEGIDWVWEHRTRDFAPLLAPASKKKVSTVREGATAYGIDRNEMQEDHRADAQLIADASKSAEERNRLGQFPTPFPVASHMVAHALKALPSDAPIAFLEPALGSGVFYSALLRQAAVTQISSATGCEIDPVYSDTAFHTPF